jgi:predicted phage tail protein
VLVIKTLLLAFFGAIVVELAVIMLATVMGLAGLTFVIIVLFLPVVLILGAIIFMLSKFFKGDSQNNKPN